MVLSACTNSVRVHAHKCVSNTRFQFTATLFGYGQTNTGKTHTIIGNENEAVPHFSSFDPHTSDSCVHAIKYMRRAYFRSHCAKFLLPCKQRQTESISSPSQYLKFITKVCSKYYHSLSSTVHDFNYFPIKLFRSSGSSTSWAKGKHFTWQQQE